MKLFLPTFKDAFRLTAPLTTIGGVVPAGTVIKLNHFRLNKTTKPDHSYVHFLCCASPDPRFAMKKYGGTADFGYSFVMLLREARELDVEIVEDFK